MGITGINLTLTVDYVSKLDKSENKTIWKLGVLNSEAYAFVSEKVATKTLKAMLDVVRFGLKGFENFKDSDGKDIKFDSVSFPLGDYNYNIVANNIIKIIPMEVIIELGAEILKLSRLSEAEVKN